MSVPRPGIGALDLCGKRQDSSDVCRVVRACRSGGGHHPADRSGRHGETVDPPPAESNESKACAILCQNTQGTLRLGGGLNTLLIDVLKAGKDRALQQPNARLSDVDENGVVAGHLQWDSFAEELSKVQWQTGRAVGAGQRPFDGQFGEVGRPAGPLPIAPLRGDHLGYPPCRGAERSAGWHRLFAGRARRCKRPCGASAPRHACPASRNTIAGGAQL